MRLNCLVSTLLTVALTMLAALPAHAERRVALVIGNGAYRNVAALPNPRNDAQDVAASLQRAGFETITGLDLDQNGMQDATIKFSRAARAADVALFYYSGHAMQFAGVNYLAPVDVRLKDEADLRRMTRVDEVVADLQQAKNLRILILDSCRDNPLAEELKRSIGPTRAITLQRGLAKIDSPEGMIVAYATQAGRTAEDGSGRNSPYTTAFLKHIEEPEEIGTVFRRISSDVYETTRHEQLPELSLSLIGEFFLRGRAEAPADRPMAAPDPCATAGDHWRSSEAIGTVAAFEDHLARFPTCAFAGLAKARLDSLKQKAAAVIAPASRPVAADPCRDKASTVSTKDPCIIRIGQTLPFTGALSAYGTIGKVQSAYFRMINDKGGINGHKINLIQYDDGYDSARTADAIRRLVELDDILFTFQTVGTATNGAVQKYLNERRIPQLFVAAGAPVFNDPKRFPWTIGFNPTYRSEGYIYARHILQNYPNAKIGILYQNDDLGRDYVTGLKNGLGDKASSMIVAQAAYNLSDSAIDAQITALKSAGADLLFDASTAKFATLAIKRSAELGWRPVHIVNINSTAVTAVMRAAGAENARGVLSGGYAKDPLDRNWNDDPGMKAYLDFMTKYYPEGDRNSSLNVYGYSSSQLLVQVLKRCGDDLSRENIMKQATTLKDVVLDLALPGVVGNTSPSDYRFNRQLRMMKFNGERWEPFGPIIEDTSAAG